jgi:tetratricopeptide (TPR) repeat protein
LAAALVAAAQGQMSADRAVPQTAPRASSAPASSQPLPEPNSAELHALGCARLEAGDAVAAIELLTRALSKKPENLDYALKLTEAHAAAGQFRDAARLLDRLVARRPETTELRLALAEIHALDENWPAVETVLSPLEKSLDADGLILLAGAYAANGRAARAGNVLHRGLKRFRDSEALWLALVDHALALRQYGLALQRIGRAEGRLGSSPRMHYRTARAFYALGQVLGQTRVIQVPGGRAGQFVNEWLLVEERDGPDRFLCCPRASALYAVRRALDGGLDEAHVHLLHARIWSQAGRPDVGLAILQGREAAWLHDASVETLATFADLALASDTLDDFLRYTRLRAAREPRRSTEILHQAYLSAAQRYNQRGDGAMSRELLRRALVLEPENVEVMLGLADAAWEAGAREEAALRYRQVLEHEPDHRDRSRILKRLGE